MITTKKGALTSTYLFLTALVAVGLGVSIVRLLTGLGATTNLSDGYPWGLWIVYDLVFIPFSAGAFMISAVTHIYNREEYHPIARPVVLAGFLGYLFVVLVLLMDLARWHKFYNILIPRYWNPHSFMFEVSMCITLYTGVLIMEVAPAILERFGLQRLLRMIRPLTVLIAGAGIMLSSLHQSSLGSLFLLMPHKLHPLWWTPLLPLLFFSSAAFSGLAMAIFVAVVSFRAFRRHLELRLLGDLARIVAIMLSIYLVLKVADLLLVGELGLVLSEGWLSLLFLAEMVIGVVVPVILFSTRRLRERTPRLVWGSVSVLVGLALNRTNVTLLGLKAPAGASYRPNWIELIVVLTSIAAGVLLFTVAVRFLPILPQDDREKPSIIPSRRSRRTAVLVGLALPLLTTFVVLLLQPVAEARAPELELTSTPPQTYARSTSADCCSCHLDQVALAQAGEERDGLVQPVIGPEPSETPHRRLDCVVCHQDAEGAGDVDAAHPAVLIDPSQSYSNRCLSCHRDLPEVFPQDQLRAPHDKAAHGQMGDVSCSDCHVGVGHGSDLVSGEVIRPMGVCLECHRTHQLDSELSGCDVCHVGPHDTATIIECNLCHQSTATWQEVALAVHPVALVGQHAQVQCFDCHQWPNFKGIQYICGDCHQRSHNTCSDDCAECHDPATGWQAAGREHPFPLDHNGANGNCTLCHAQGDTSTYLCEICHSQSDVQPVHEAKGLEDIVGQCVLCHPQGQKP